MSVKVLGIITTKFGVGGHRRRLTRLACNDRITACLAMAILLKKAPFLSEFDSHHSGFDIRIAFLRLQPTHLGDAGRNQTGLRDHA